jgi:hypothetical protein
MDNQALKLIEAQAKLNNAMVRFEHVVQTVEDLVSSFIATHDNGHTKKDTHNGLLPNDYKLDNKWWC